VDLLVANDLDTLLANYLIAKLKRVPILYDSHEYFTEVPELINRKKIQRIWEKIESYIFPKLPLAITVSNSIANIYSKKYGIPVHVIRNVPEINVKYKIIDIRKELNLHHRPILLYQGSLNIGRGIEFLVESMSFLENVYLLIIGSGDIEQDLKRKVKELNLQDKVIFLGKIENQKLKSITPNALLGFSLEEDRGMNYRFALPNKIFDYIHASVPVICSDLPEMKTIVEKYKVGLSLNYYQMTAEAFANTIKNIVKDNQTISFWKNNCAIASKELCWENEKLKFKEILAKLITN
jgi:glycosyltransferase involved in cell wall biosynthesis